MTLTAPRGVIGKRRHGGNEEMLLGQWLTEVAGELKARLSDFDPARVTGIDAAALVEQFTEVSNLCSSGVALSAARAAQAEIHRRTGHRSSAEWLAETSGGTQHDAAQTLELGAVLVEHPELDEALRSGSLERGRAVLVAETLKVNPDSGIELVRAATSATRRGLRDACDRAKARARSKEQEEARARRVHAARKVRFWTDRHDGSVHLEGSLDPLAGAQLQAVLEARARRIFEAARQTGVHEAHEAYLADALVELATSDGPSADPGTGRGSGPQARVHIRVDLDVLRRAQGTLDESDHKPGGICEIPGVGPVPVSVVEELLGEAVTHLLVTDGIDVTTVCGVGRTVPVAVREALIERDRNCVVPGCEVRHHLEMDHWQVDFAKGGLTTLANLARLCQKHHDMKTRGLFTLEGGPGRWAWVPVKDPPAAVDAREGPGGWGQSGTEDDGQYRFYEGI